MGLAEKAVQREALALSRPGRGSRNVELDGVDGRSGVPGREGNTAVKIFALERGGFCFLGCSFLCWLIVIFDEAKTWFGFV